MLPSYGINFVLFLFKSFSFLLPFFFLSFPFPDTTETMAECLCVYNTKKKKKKSCRELPEMRRKESGESLTYYATLRK